MWDDGSTRDWTDEPEDRRPEAVIVTDELAPALWTSEDICGIYFRMIVKGLLDEELAPLRIMEYWATRLGHYGRIALEEKDQRRRNAEHRRQVDTGFAAIRAGFGG